MKAEHHHFFSRQVEHDTIVLDRNESHHARTVLRLRSGDLFDVTDGRGFLYHCRAGDPESPILTGEIVSREFRPQDAPAVHCYLGIPDKDAFELALDMLIPLGVASITPVECEYSQKGWWRGNWDKQLDRFERKMIVAIKQSLSPWLPVLLPPTKFEQAQERASGLLVVADETGEEITNSLPDPLPGEVSCFVGPPGGFSPGELDSLRRSQGRFVALNSHRLRTELAAIVLVSAVIALRGIRK